jgi:hypothetical protein
MLRTPGFTMTIVSTLLAGVTACHDGGGGGGDHPDGGVVNPVSVHPPTLQPAPVDTDPTAPVGPGGPLGWTPAPIIDGVQYAPDRDSLELVLPVVAGARDYRAILLSPTIGVSADGDGEKVTGTTIVCAGYLQRSTRTPVHDLIDTIQVAGLSGDTRIVLEALDAPCPYTGLIAAKHEDLDRSSKVNPEIVAKDSRSYAVFTEAEVATTYGATIFNGHGGAVASGDPAPPSSPKVLARTTVVVAPTGTSAPAPVTGFFDDFAEADQPVKTSDGATCYPPACDHPFIDIFQNKKWTFEAAGMDVDQYFIDRGQLHAVMADGGADDFASTVAYPKQLAHVSDTGYLHATYAVNALTTARRYPWLSVCGADAPGKTINADGTPAAHLNPDSSLQLADGKNPNLAGWNCLMLFSKDGNYLMPLADGAGGESPPETDMRVLVYKSGTGVTGVNVSPDIYKNGWMPSSWFRMIKGDGTVTGPMIDHQNLTAPTTRFDVFVRRGRVIVYVDGQQKLCNDFDPALMTMSEAMVGFGQVLYHTSAEHNEIESEANAPSGTVPRFHYIYDNAKYFDRRDWDSLGFEDNVAPPASGPAAFDESACYKHVTP